MGGSVRGDRLVSFFYYFHGMEGWKDGRMEEWNVEALAEIPLRREKSGILDKLDEVLCSLRFAQE